MSSPLEDNDLIEENDLFEDNYIQKKDKKKLKAKEYLPFFIVSFIITMLVTNLVLFLMGNLPPKGGLESLGLIYVIFIIPITISLTYIFTRESIRERFPKLLNSWGSEREKPEGKKEEERSRHIPQHVKREVWRRDMGRCVDCGSRINLEYDHIIPFSKGGSNTVRNIELLCEKCNRSKSNNI